VGPPLIELCGFCMWYLYKIYHPPPEPGSLGRGVGAQGGGGPALNSRKKCNLKRYAIITWDIIRYYLTRY